LFHFTVHNVLTFPIGFVFLFIFGNMNPKKPANRVFLTGASGLLGYNLLIRLLDSGYQVYALVRNRSSLQHLSSEKLRVIEGDLLVENDYSAMQACDLVIHAAADTRQNARHCKDYSANTLGTDLLLKACKKYNIRKLIYIGTANVFAHGTKDFPGDESKGTMRPFINSPYVQSKRYAQNKVEDMASTINCTSICPTFMIGPNDFKPSSGRIFNSILKKRWAFFPSGGKSFVHVNDVVDVIMHCLHRNASGEQFVVSNENLSYKEFFEKVIRLNGQKTRLIKLPNSMLYVVGLLGEVLRIMHLPTSASLTNVKILMISNYYSHAKVQKEFGIQFKPIDQAIKDALRYRNEKV
jgi:dihydroflavonol-4-reductase